MGSGRVTFKEIKEIIRLTKEGLSRPKIAEKLGRSTNTIWRYQKKYLE